MVVNRRLVGAHQVAVRAVGHGHDIDMIEFRAALAPVAVGQDMMTPDFLARLDFPSRRHRPVEEGVEAGDALAGGRRLDVLQEGRETPDDFALVEALRDLEENRQRQIGLARARFPKILADFVGGKFALERHQDAPFEFGQLHAADRVHLRGRVRNRSRLHRLAAGVPDAERENSLRRHEPVMPRADLVAEEVGMFAHGKTVRHFQRGPEFVLRAGSLRVGRADHDVA